MSNFEWWVIEQKTNFEVKDILRDQVEKRPWAAYFLHDRPVSTSVDSVCRIGFVPYDRCIQDRFFCIDCSRNPEILAGGGITTQIYWDHDPKNLPSGWQDTIRQSYLDANTKGRKPNTQVALLAFATQRFKKQGVSDKVLSQMCRKAQERGYSYLIIPILPPTQFEKEHVRISMEEISNLKREDGEDYDYWIRVHKRKGATVIGNCEYSHRFVFSLDDFSRHISSDIIETSGEHLVRLDKDETLGPNSKNTWQIVYADLDRSFIVFNWGCIWMQYDLKKLNLNSTE